mmetsp:Transcript_2478/g.5975  ORF Transcript_2478/g.5975 Transcript_2478/m.5975 type:complete len:892 (-) Transcript_2478:224-2899(-)
MPAVLSASQLEWLRSVAENGVDIRLSAETAAPATMTVPPFLVALALVSAFVFLLVMIGRLTLFRGEMCNGRLFSDHLSCRSLAWLDCWGRGVSYPGAAKPPNKRQKHRGRWLDRSITLKKGWRYVGAEESHAVTEKNLKKQTGQDVKLCGEAVGRQTWVFEEGQGPTPPPFEPSRNPNSSDKLFRDQRLSAWKGAKPTKGRPATPKDAAKKGIEFYQQLLCDDGHFAGDYGGPMFLMPGLIFVCYITGFDLGPRKEAMITYLRNHQQYDGGWGTHIEAASTMFGTVLSYVSLRLLGVPCNDVQAMHAREFIKGHGGALQCPSWAKFWLSVLGVFEWEGVNSIPSEMWCLPHWFPFHPGKLWCHCRMVYLPMCYLYCTRFQNPTKHTDPLLRDLRLEIFCQDYDSIVWDNYRHTVCPLDDYSPVTYFQMTIHNVLAFYETYLSLWKLPPFSYARSWGVRIAMDYIKAEDIQTNYVDIGPVNKTLNMLSIWVDAGHTHSKEFLAHAARLDDYLWVAEDGMKMQGYNGSQCWDTSFAIQAVLESGLAPEFPWLCEKVYTYLERTQILSTPASKASAAYQYEDLAMRKKYFRHVSQGGWPFSTSAHGWPISDCTSEGLKGVLGLMDMESVRATGVKFVDQRLFDAVNVLLTYQNADGGWATYENNRGFGFYEWMNPSEVFGDIMIDYSYVECSSASMTALAKFAKRIPTHRSGEIKSALVRGGRFLESIQRPDGSWYGSWAVCFTYACFFGVEGLLAAGRPQSCKAIRKCVEFLLSKQNNNGGWGETYLSCVDKVYTQDSMFTSGESGVVQTAWALLGLMAAGVSEPKEREAVERGIKFLMLKQKDSGDWDQENITGVFNRSCGITYTSYRNTFPIWALGRYTHWKQHIEAHHSH